MESNGKNRGKDMDWQSLFMDHILDRGYDYYADNAVEDIKIEENRVAAIVCGTENYEVEISLQGEDVATMYCSCPYAASGT